MSRELLNAEAISRGESLGLLARQIIEGYRVGEHRSPYHGFAIEFAQHREYTHGDDTRHLDWKMLGRSDRYYIKQYEQDTNFITHLILDGSRSMQYASAEGDDRLSKLHYAKALTACLSYLILQQRDAVALDLIDSQLREHHHRTDSMQKLPLILERLAAFEGEEKTSLGEALEQVSGVVKKRGIVMVLSDLFDDEDSIAKGLQRLANTNNEVVVFHVLHSDELTFPFNGTWRFRQLEGGEEIETTPSDFRESYLKKFEAYRERMRALCHKYQAQYVLVDTSKPLAEVLGGYLAFRQSLKRRR